MDQLLYLLFKLAVISTPYPWPIDEGLPKVEYINEVLIDGESYGHYYEGWISLPPQCKDQMINSPHCRAIYIHESIHYLQDINGHLNRNDCSSIYNNEVEAYNVQISYLKKYGFIIKKANIIMPKECL